MEGIQLVPSADAQIEPRQKTLILKGILVYFLVMGGMGCYLSAFSVDYHKWTLHLVLLAVALFCALLYYTVRWENAGYLLLLLVMSVIAYYFKTYINSGFYAVLNDVAEEASAYFGTNAMRSYGEQVSNRTLAITIAMCYVGGVCIVLINVLISRRMQYLTMLMLIMGILQVPLYLELEPDLFHTVMLYGGIFMAYVIRGSGHYGLSYNNSGYRWENNGKKKSISYTYNVRTMAGSSLLILLVCLVTAAVTTAVYPVQRTGQKKESHLKQQTKDIMQNVYLLGLAGLFNFYPNTGGLTSGKLGGVSSVRLDYNPDLDVIFRPYTSDRIYLKNFTGKEYLPYENRWGREELTKEKGGTKEAEYWEKKYQKKEGAKGRIDVKNIAAAVGSYLPYYTKQLDQSVYPGETKSYSFYPMQSDGTKKNTGNKKEKKKTTESIDRSVWLDVPEENKEVIEAFCRQAGLSGTPQEIVNQLSAYYQANIPYTLQPGITPQNKDFINYFLAENKRGYCAHFASAATLIFRSMGIPARYVEGYAIDTADLSEDGKIRRDMDADRYYQGKAELDADAVVELEVTDASAHAWVEIYDDVTGWTPADVTPASDEEETASGGIWQMLMHLLRGASTGKDQTTSDTSSAAGKAVADENSRRVSYMALTVLAGLLLCALLGQWIVRYAYFQYRLHMADNNDRLILLYGRYMHRVLHRHREAAGLVNYRQQINWLCSQGLWTLDDEQKEECIRILEQAGFSNRQIRQEELEMVSSHFA